MYLCADIDELREDTGFNPSVSFEEGILKTINWVKSVGLRC
jgi:nucleoside-diphosphate-sugar epimerase